MDSNPQKAPLSTMNIDRATLPRSSVRVTRSRRRAVLRNVGIPILSIALLLLLWEAIVVVFHVAPYIAPRPLAAIQSVTDNWGSLWPLVLGTIRETIYGFVCGTILGIGLGVVMAKAPFLHRMVYPVLVLSQGVPIIALGAPIVLILGFGIAPKVVIVAWIVFFPVTVNVVAGLSHVDQDLLNLARVYGASKWRTFFLIEIPASSTSLFAGLKIGATYAVTGAIIGELVSPSGASGSLALYQEHANTNFNVAAVYGTTMVMTAIGISWFLLIVASEVVATPWQRRTVARRSLFHREPGVDLTSTGH
jgi:ABC-type nitrate/sulfonate/bicarbonate transport system permease component